MIVIDIRVAVYDKQLNRTCEIYNATDFEYFKNNTEIFMLFLNQIHNNISVIYFTLPFDRCKIIIQM